MPEDSEHFDRAEQSWAVNFRVDDLDGMVAQLRSGGIEVEVDAGGASPVVRLVVGGAGPP